MARTRAADYEDKQRGILDGASAVFAEMGMDKASMAQIATYCGISKSLLYHYYDSKNALVFDIIRVHLSALDEALAAADLPQLTPQQQLRRLVHEVLEHYRDADDRHKVQLNAPGMLTDAQSAEIKAIEKRIVHRFAAVLARNNPRLSDGAMLMPVTMSLFGILNWVYLWFRSDGAMNRQAYGDMVCDLMLGGIRDLN